MSTTAAVAITVGLHLASVHAPDRDGQHNVNPGVYLRVDEAAEGLKGFKGLTLGAYRNTLGRTSVYLAHTHGWATPAGWPVSSVDVTLGAVSGYRRECVTRQRVKLFDLGTRGSGSSTVTETECHGNSAHALAPLIVPSIALPVRMLGLTPRLSFIAHKGGHRNGSSAFHLSAEHRF